MYITAELDLRSKLRLGVLMKRLTQAELYAKIKPLFRKMSSKAAAHIVKTQLSGQALKRRTGGLARSITGQLTDVDGVPAIRVGVFRGSATAYARIQEFGGEIVPRFAKALAIPTEEALTPAGVERYGGPMKYPGILKFILFGGGRGNVIGGLQDMDTLKIIYLLVRKVKLEGKHYLRNGMREYLPLAVAEIQEALVQWYSEK